MKFNCDSQNAKSWQIRAEKAVDLLCDATITSISEEKILQIGDFGCGNERLKEILAGKINCPFAYYGYDLYPQLESTYAINLEVEIPSKKFDIIFCLGLLEYLTCVDNFLANLAQICRWTIISYVVGDSGFYSLQDVQEKGWLNHYLIRELEAKFAQNNFNKNSFLLINQGKTGLWLLQSKIFVN